jgi:hypothetical protein
MLPTIFTKSLSRNYNFPNVTEIASSSMPKKEKLKAKEIEGNNFEKEFRKMIKEIQELKKIIPESVIQELKEEASSSSNNETTGEKKGKKNEDETLENKKDVE